MYIFKRTINIALLQYLLLTFADDVNVTRRPTVHKHVKDFLLSILNVTEVLIVNRGLTEH